MKIIGTLIAALAIVPLSRGAVIFAEASEKDRTGAEKYVRHHSEHLVKGGGGKEELTIGFPHFSYGVQAPNVQAGELVRAAKLYSLRHLILNDSKAIGAVELTPKRNIFGRRSFRTIGTSPLASRFVETLGKAEQLNETRANDYEGRLLNIAPLHFQALWLHGPDDLFVPIAGFQTQLFPGIVFREKELLQVFKGANQSVLLSDSPEVLPALVRSWGNQKEFFREGKFEIVRWRNAQSLLLVSTCISPNTYLRGFWG